MEAETISAVCKDKFYAARDEGRTMHQAADDVAATLKPLIDAEVRKAAEHGAETVIGRGVRWLAGKTLFASQKGADGSEMPLAAPASSLRDALTRGES